ncbi:MAG: RumA: predicted 23S rRNA mehtyltransferase [Candidatus Uhrbacteria bacterium GW2011_GWA2_53_10]|uniref:RumA: predicted 23S rRNA mehtyltransferase n=1 Tax=Candidatus Uhrbacteria bacterium GW2011_GWA2_53_10 TaxID=1618980 RepID=A0A0G2AIX7_9BACT|nr:MAG: RumA: predicted 23S rRNA mehtyltransferase [Candidatus Uhrbacteria bacterium GW2011_GWA2_53_10]
MLARASNNLPAGSLHTVKIEKLTHGGAGLAHIGDIPVFIHGTIPGQEAQVEITRNKGSFAEAKTIKITRKSKDQINPKCSHCHDCGGCAWQNISYDKQIAYKEEIVKETLEHLTPVGHETRSQLKGRVLKIIPSPQIFHYRNKLELSFGCSVIRSEEKDGKKIYKEENPTIGFHCPGQWATVLPVTECHLYDEQLSSLLSDVRQFLLSTRLPVYSPKTHKGLLRTLLLRRGINTGEIMIAFIVKARKRELEPLFQHFMRFGGRSGLASLLVIENLGISDRPENPNVHCLVGNKSIRERIFDLEFDISPFSFFQTNTLAIEKLYQAIADGADLTARDTVLDAYCGMGTIGQYLSRFCEKVIGIESHPTAVEDALRSAGKNRIGNISFYKGRVEHVLSSQLKPGGKYKFKVMVLDPPRAGLHPSAREAIAAHAPEKIVYVSCNTATLARDMGEFMKKGYELRSVQPVDMFPHTAHIETVSVLQRKT